MYLLAIWFSPWESSHTYPSSTCSPTPLLTSSMSRAFHSYSHDTRSILPCSTSKWARPVLSPHTALPSSLIQKVLLLTEDSLYNSVIPQIIGSVVFFLALVKMSSAFPMHHVHFSHSLIMHCHLCPTSRLCTLSNPFPASNYLAIRSL